MITRQGLTQNLLSTPIKLPDVPDILTLQSNYLIGWGNTIPYYGKVIRVLNYNGKPATITIVEGASNNMNSQIYVNSNTLDLLYNPSSYLPNTSNIESHIQSIDGLLYAANINTKYPTTTNNSINVCRVDKNGYPMYLIHEDDGSPLLTPLRATINNTPVNIANSISLQYNHAINYCYIDVNGLAFCNSIPPELVNGINYGIGYYLNFSSNIDDMFNNTWRCNVINGNPASYIVNSSLYLDTLKGIGTFVQIPSVLYIRQHMAFSFSFCWMIDFYFKITYTSDGTLFQIINNDTNFGMLKLIYDASNLKLSSSFDGSTNNISQAIGSYVSGSTNYIAIRFDSQVMKVNLNGNPTVSMPVNNFSYQYIMHEMFIGNDPALNSSKTTINEFTFTPYIRNLQTIFNTPNTIIANPSTLYGNSFASYIDLHTDIIDHYSNILWYGVGNLNYTVDGLTVDANNYIYTVNFPIVTNVPTWSIDFNVYVSAYGRVMKWGQVYNGMNIIISPNSIDIHLGTDDTVTPQITLNVPGSFPLNVKYRVLITYASYYTVYIDNVITAVLSDAGNLVADPIFIIGNETFSGCVEEFRFTPFLVGPDTAFGMNCYKDFYDTSTSSWIRLGASNTNNASDILYIGSYTEENIIQWFDTMPDINNNLKLTNNKYSTDKNIIFYEGSGRVTYLPHPGSVSFFKAHFPPIKLIAVGLYNIIVDTSNYVYLFGDNTNAYSLPPPIYKGNNITYVDVGSLNFDSTDLSYKNGYIIDDSELYVIGPNTLGGLGLGNNTAVTTFTKVNRIPIADNSWQEIYTSGAHAFAIVGTSRQLYYAGTGGFNPCDNSSSRDTFCQCYFSNNLPIDNVTKVKFRVAYSYMHAIIVSNSRVYCICYRSGSAAKGIFSLGSNSMAIRDESQGFIDMGLDNIVDLADSGVDNLLTNCCFAIDMWGAIYVICGAYSDTTVYVTQPYKLYMNKELFIVKKILHPSVHGLWLMAILHDGRTYVMMNNLFENDIVNRTSGNGPITSFMKYPRDYIVDGVAFNFYGNSGSINAYYLLDVENKIYFCDGVNVFSLTRLTVP